MTVFKNRAASSVVDTSTTPLPALVPAQEPQKGQIPGLTGPTEVLRNRLGIGVGAVDHHFKRIRRQEGLHLCRSMRPA